MSFKQQRNPKNRSEAGQSLVELVIGISFILVLLAGIVDLGRAFISFQALREAAQEGAMYASIHPTDAAGIAARARGTSQQPVPLANTTIVTVNTYVIKATTGQRYSAASAPALLCQGNLFEVQIVYDHVITTPFVGAIVGGQEVELTASSRSTILKPKCP